MWVDIPPIYLPLCPACPIVQLSNIPAPAWCVPYTRPCVVSPCVWMCKVGHMTGVGAAVWPATSPAAAHHRTTQPVRFKLHLDSAAWLPSLPSLPWHSSLYLLSTIYYLLSTQHCTGEISGDISTELAAAAAPQPPTISFVWLCGVDSVDSRYWLLQHRSF